ncbi:class I SAM-dependent methyltransferase [Tannockella kyphosi]|uniref:class I SAM-dependent methyltransferase n=1 Tax=Tannockella kyphosi TaxID=2899121 RepID=UPI0020116849|nr:hypothetical protein [Tannockella kyphosi]
MSEYIYLIVVLFGMLIFTKILSLEISVRALEKRKQATGFYLQFDGKFRYRRPRHLLIVCAFVYLYSSSQTILSTVWFLELIGFIAVVIIAEGLSQYASYEYCHIRYKNKYDNLHLLKESISLELEQTGQKEHSRLLSYHVQRITEDYFKEDKHLAFLSNDHGKSVNMFPTIPPITYVVDTDKTITEDTLINKNIKVTTLTKEGSLPFKDDKLDVVYTCDVNYDKFELYRVTKPGGHILVSQLGHDNFMEVIRWILPFRMKGEWNRQECSRTLSDIGFEIVDSFEDHGKIRFSSFKETIEFVNSLLATKLEMKDVYMNFYTSILNEIEEKGYFEISTHNFLVIAKKPESA